VVPPDTPGCRDTPFGNHCCTLISKMAPCKPSITSHWTLNILSTWQSLDIPRKFQHHCYLEFVFGYVLCRKRIELNRTYHDPCLYWSPLVAPEAEEGIGVSWAGMELPTVDCSMLWNPALPGVLAKKETGSVPLLIHLLRPAADRRHLKAQLLLLKTLRNLGCISSLCSVRVRPKVSA
jgi:hypothetical protein